MLLWKAKMEAAQSTFIMVAATELSYLIRRYVSDWLEKTRTTFFIQSEISIADALSFSRAWFKLFFNSFLAFGCSRFLVAT